jgi:hypothetical protein
VKRPHIGAASTKSGRTEERHQPGGEGSLYQGISSGKLSATARKPMANAVASAKKMTTTSPSRDIAFPLGPIHFVRCGCLFASENSELSQRKSPSERGCSGPCTRRTTAALWRRFFWNAWWRGAFFMAGFSTRCHSSLLMPHPGGAFFAIWYASRVAQLAIHKDGLASVSQRKLTDRAVLRLPVAIRQ